MSSSSSSSSIEVEFRVVCGGKPSRAFTTPRSVVDMERKFQCGAMELFTGPSPRMEALYWLAWQSLTIAGEATAAFDVWLDSLEIFEVDPGETIPLPPPVE